jgi:hypothetical protein
VIRATKGIKEKRDFKEKTASKALRVLMERILN